MDVGSLYAHLRQNAIVHVVAEPLLAWGLNYYDGPWQALQVEIDYSSFAQVSRYPADVTFVSYGGGFANIQAQDHPLTHWVGRVGDFYLHRPTLSPIQRPLTHKEGPSTRANPAHPL